MSEENESNLEGFAQMIHNQFVRPLENSQKFKETYINTNITIFLNMIDATHSVVLLIDEGNIDVLGIPQSDEEKIKEAAKNCDVKIETTMRLFVEMDKMSTLKVLGKIIRGKLKIKGGKKLEILQELRALANEEDEAMIDY
jgi:hypothetical protein